MKSISNRGEVRSLLRELGGQLSLLNRQVGANVDLREADVGCLDLLARRGAMSPSALASAAGLHPATLTGVLDRLEAGGWIVRARDPGDRRAVVVQPLGKRAPELMGLYGSMNRAVEDICAGYSARELATIADFLARVTAAGRIANAELSAGS
jgi:DNA-binding MarR family transcriptional regulator